MTGPQHYLAAEQLLEHAATMQARLVPVSGINGSDEQERRGVSTLLAVVNSVREFGRAITAPLGAPAGALTAYIGVPFTSGDKKVRSDGLVQVKRGGAVWAALVEVKTGANELKAPQVQAYLDVAREQGFNAVLTTSNQLAGAPGAHALFIDGRRLRRVGLHHLSWNQLLTEALVARANKAVSDPDQAWILNEFIRYLQHPRSGAAEFEDMGVAEPRTGSRDSLRARVSLALSWFRRIAACVSLLS